MAPKRSDVQLQEIAAFVTELYRWGRYATQAEWAEDARFPQSNLSNVMGGTAGIDGLNLIRLYKAAERRALTERPVTVAADEEFREFAVRLRDLTREMTRRLGVEEADG